MLDRLAALLKVPPPAKPGGGSADFGRRDIAVVALLVELAQGDRSTPAVELAAVERIVRERFGLDADRASRLIAAARAELDCALEDWMFADAVRKGFDEPQRGEIVERLWEVVYADGKLARLEESLMRRVASELDIGEAESESARARAFARSGLARGARTDGTESE